MSPTDFLSLTRRKFAGLMIGFQSVSAHSWLVRTHTVEEAMSEMSQAKVAGGVFVQCYSDCPEEVDWVFSQVAAHPGVLGVVGGLDLTKHDKVETFWNLFLTETPHLTNR